LLPRALFVKGVGYSFTSSPFFFNAQAAMNASAWSLQGGDLGCRTAMTLPRYCPPPGNCVFYFSENWVNLGFDFRFGERDKSRKQFRTAHLEVFEEP
jgi:hypothetical protein